MAYLVVTVKDKELYRRELTGPVTLGRSTECDLWLNDNGVSISPNGTATLLKRP